MPYSRLQFLCFSLITALSSPLWSGSCGDSAIKEPLYLELNRTVTESPFVGITEFVQSGPLPEYYRTLSYSGAWNSGATEIHWSCQYATELDDGSVSAQFAGAWKFDLSGNETSVGAATPSGGDYVAVDLRSKVLSGGFPRAGAGYESMTVMPLGVSSESSLSRTYSTLPGTCSGLYKLSINHYSAWPRWGSGLSGSATLTLSEQDTIQDALSNWNNRGGSQVFDNGNEAYLLRDSTEAREGKLEIEAEFEACKDERLTIHYILRKYDSSGSFLNEETRTKTVTGDSDWRARFELSIEAGLGERIAFSKIYATPESACDSSTGNGHSSGGEVRSLHWFSSLGALYEGRVAGELRIDKEDWSNLAFSPADLTFTTSVSTQTSVVEDTNGWIRQVLTPKDIADITVLVASTSYRIDIHELAHAGTPDPITGIYPVSGTAHTTYTISKETVGTEERMRIVESGTGSDQTEFAYASSGGVETWKLYEGGGTRLVERISEELTSVPSGLETIDHFSKPYVPTGFPPEFFTWTDPPVYVSEIEQIKDASGNVLEKRESIYQHVVVGTGLTEEFGTQTPTTIFELLRRERIYTDSSTVPDHEITYYYGTDSSASDHVRLVLTEDSRGDWADRRYDTEGRLWQVESSFQGSSQTDPSSLNRLLTYSYADLADIDGDGEVESLETRTVTLLGQDVSRRFVLDLSGTQTLNGVAVSEKHYSDGITPSADWDSAGNLIERVWTYADETSEFYLENYARSRPDGTGRIWLAVRQGDGTIDVAESVGALDDPAAPTAVAAGMATVKHLDTTGVLLDETTTDVESNLVVAQSIHSNFDDYGRAQRTDYLDGSFETRVYACCGLQSFTGRNGLTTIYDYDDLKEIEYTTTAVGTSAQQVIRMVYDAAGNLQTTSKGSDEMNLTPVAEFDYDYSGAMVASRERYLDAQPSVSRQTTVGEVIDSGYIVTTTTYPNTSTRIEKSYPNGKPHETTGTAVRGMRYVSGVETDATLGYAVRTETQTYLESDGSLIAEYTKTYRDALGHIYKTETPASGGDTATFRNSYNAMGQLVSSEDPDGLVTLFAYGAEGVREVTALDVDGDGTISYDGTDRIIRNRGNYASRTETSGTYTVTRRTTEIWEDDGADTPKILASIDTTVGALTGGDTGTIQWNTAYGQTTVKETLIDRTNATLTTTSTFPDTSYQVELTVNGLLQISTRHHSDDSILSQQTFAYVASDENRLDSVTDLYNGLSDYEYYADGQLKFATTPDPDTVQSGEGYDPQTTSFVYTDDATSISRTTTLPDTSTVTELFNPTGELKEKSGSQTYPVAYTYDYAGRLRSQTTWQDKATSAGETLTAWEYFDNGLLKKKWYDATIDGVGVITGTAGSSYGYTAAGRIETKTNARETVATYAYAPDSFDLTGLSYDDSLTPPVSYSNYDRQGRPRSVTDASGTRQLEYQDGQLMDETYTGGSLSGYAIDRRRDNLNRYDRLSLKLGITELHKVAYGYDGASRLESVSSRDQKVTYSYDPTAELRKTLTFENGSSNVLTVEERRDNLNRLKSIKTLDSSLQVLDSHLYLNNDLNQRIRHTCADGSYWSFGYDSLGQVDSAVRYNSSDVAIPGYNFGYSFDEIGNRTQTTTNGRTASYTPDNLNQYDERAVPRALDVRGSVVDVPSVLVAVNTNQINQPINGNFHHELDLTAGGNDAQKVDILVTATLPDGGDNNAPRIADAEKSEYLPPNPEVFVHDDDGNLDEDGKWSYVWDAENRLIEMETLSAAVTAGADQLKLEFGYDSQGRRFSKNVYEWDGSAYQLAGVILYVWDGWNLIYELGDLQDGSQIEKAYVWGNDLSGTIRDAGGVGGLLMTILAQKAVYFPSFDGNGNVVNYIDGASGGKVAQYAYTPFGQLLQATGTHKDEFDFRFSTKPSDQETGLVAYQLRFYNPDLGRWLSRDLIGEQGGLNLYGMADNDAVNYFDDLGQQKITGGYTGPVPTGNRSPHPVTPVVSPNYKVPDVKKDVIQTPTQNPIPRGPAGAAGGVANLIGQVQDFKNQLNEINVTRALQGIAVRSIRVCNAQRRLAGIPEGCGCCVTVLIVSRQNPATNIRGFFGRRAYLPPSGPITKVYGFDINYVPVKCSKTERGGINYNLTGRDRSEYIVKHPN